MAIGQLLLRGQTQGEIVKPPLFDGEKKKMVGFINACCLYISMRIKGSGRSVEGKHIGEEKTRAVIGGNCHKPI